MVFEGKARDTACGNRREPQDQTSSASSTRSWSSSARDRSIRFRNYELITDLGVAFKEMGLLDKPLEISRGAQGTEGRLRTSKRWAHAFFEKGLRRL